MKAWYRCCKSSCWEAIIFLQGCTYISRCICGTWVIRNRLEEDTLIDRIEQTNINLEKVNKNLEDMKNNL